jgi:signal transduction histidine kinase
VAEAVVKEGVAATGAYGGTVLRLSADGRALELMRAMGYEADQLAPFARVPLAAPLPLTRALTGGAPIFLESPAEFARFPALPAASARHSGALVAVPLVVEGNGIGVLGFSYPQARRFSEDERAFVSALANQCAQALERARLFEAERAARQRAEAAQHEAEEAARRKDEFLAMLGHELRNPLAPMMTALQLMKLRGVGGEHEQEVVERQVQHLARLVDDLLDVSRITRGKVQIKKTPVEVATVVAKAIEMTDPLLEQRSHTLSLEVPRTGLAVDGDAVRLAQVLSNLLSNAAKYTDPGGRTAVRAWREGPAVVISVKDTGVGIPAEMLPTVFELFVQGDRTLDRSQGGLGIGLTLARRLVELHGGTITAHSDGPGQGSEFMIRLPALPPGVEAAPPALAAPTPLRSPVVASGRRILVVDDNVDAADSLADVLREWGHEVATVHDGAAALSTMAAFDPHIALVDIGLPVMDGYQLARLVRQRLGEKPLRLIAISGYGQEADKARSLEVGFDVHLVKPVDLDIMADVLNRGR